VAARAGWVEATFAPIGQAVLAALEFVGECAGLLFDAGRRLFTRPFEGLELLRQMSFIGVSSVPIVALTTFFSGAVLALYTSDVLVRYGAQSLAGAAVGLAILREIGPVLAGIMVAARCGSAIAAEIGSMQVTEQVDALRSLNVSPINYLVIPRVVAAVFTLPVLGLVAAFSGVLGGYLVSVATANVPDSVFLDSVRQFVAPSDLWKGVLKTAVFGLIVAIVACQQGLGTRNGAVGVGHATTRTVVITMVLIYVVNYFMSAALFRVGG